MAVFGKKSYGDYKTDICVFCGGASFKKNKIGLPVCKNHENESGSPAYKCICGEWLDISVGKFGPYARCVRCGNINLNKVFEVNRGLESQPKSEIMGNHLDGFYKIQKSSKGNVSAKNDEPKIFPKLSDVDSTKAIETDPNYKKKRELECGIFFD